MSPAPSLCEPHREWITSALEQDRNAVAIWQDLVDQLGFTGRYNSVKRYVRELRGSAIILAHPTIVTAPGEEAQVDYGDVSQLGLSSPPVARPSRSTPAQ